MLAARAAVAAVAAARSRRRRAYRASASATHLTKRRQILGVYSLQRREHLFQSRLDMTSQQATRRRHSVADRLPAHFILPSPNNNMDNPSSNLPAAPVAVRGGLARTRSAHSRSESTSSLLMAPISKEEGQGIPLRRGHSRSKSTMCRQVNRLSLTLPIAPPTSDPSRPTPSSSTMPSIPPTPVDSIASSPADASEFIIAIAAQERRVLELREELTRAEVELTLLKKKWTTQEKKGDSLPFEAYRSSVAVPDDESAQARRSVDSDRRKLLQQTQSTPAQPRRKVLRGGHTRTLSLLSPAKTDAGFSLHEDRDHDQEPMKLPSIERRTAQLTNPYLNKRASWQPRTQQPGVVVPGIVEDFKLGLRAFVEDIRQITVGDEPVTGQSVRPNEQPNDTGRDTLRSQETVRAHRPLRPRVSTVFEPPHSSSETPEGSTKKATRPSAVSTVGSKTNAKANTKTKTESAAKPKVERSKAKNKSFSWTPLGLDSLDDNDWSNWDSPSSAKTSRWSGSTMGSTGMDDLSATSDEGEQNTTPL